MGNVLRKLVGQLHKRKCIEAYLSENERANKTIVLPCLTSWLSSQGSSIKVSSSDQHNAKQNTE